MVEKLKVIIEKDANELIQSHSRESSLSMELSKMRD